VRTGVQIVAAVAAAIALAGCGGSAGPAKAGSPAKTADSRTAATIIAQLKTAVKAAKSVHVAGTVRESGRTDSLDISLTRSGDLSGFIESAGTKLEIIDAGHVAYIKVTSAFLKLAHGPASICQKLCGKYVAADASDGKKIVGDLSMSKLLGELTDSMPSFHKAGTTTVGGQQALILHGADGSTLDVAAVGQPYPLRAVAPKSNNSELDFSQWNAVPAIAAPPAGQVISLSQLAG
jgi:hypothetical protein